MPQSMYNNDIEMEDIPELDQFLGQNQPNMFNY